MATATAAAPDPGEPPVNTIGDEEWRRLLGKRVVAGPQVASYADLREVARSLRERHRRQQAGSN
jgi:hypothetical protein